MRRRLLRVFVRRGLLPGDDLRAMGQWAHGGGFSVDGSVRIEAADRAGRERLLRYCARPPFALDRLRELGPERLLYKGTKPGPGGGGPLLLTPLELIERIAALVPPPRIHRHRYFGVLARTAAHRNFPRRLRMARVGPKAQVDARRLNIRQRGVVAVDSPNRNGSSHRFQSPLRAPPNVDNGSTTVDRSVAMSGGSTIHTGRSRLDD